MGVKLGISKCVKTGHVLCGLQILRIYQKLVKQTLPILQHWDGLSHVMCGVLVVF